MSNYPDGTSQADIDRAIQGPRCRKCGKEMDSDEYCDRCAGEACDDEYGREEDRQYDEWIDTQLNPERRPK